MKKFLVLALVSIMTVAVLSSCGTEKAGNDEASSTVKISVVDNTAEDGVIAEDLEVEVQEGMTVLSATYKALTDNGIACEFTEDEAHFSAIDGKADFYFGETEETKYWHYTLNGEDLIDEEGYEPAVKTVSADDVIIWNYDICEE